MPLAKRLAVAGEAGFVTDPIDWKYSSARNYQDDQTVLQIDSDGYLLGLSKL